tara:strand:- start:56 stop:271 length:216 start_codon:yes stop_codon:yes gene_type:complete
MADAFDAAWSISKNMMSEQENAQYRECMEHLSDAMECLEDFGEHHHADDIKRIMADIQMNYGAMALPDEGR